MSAGWDTTPQAELGVCVGVDQLVPGDAAGMQAYADRLRRVADGAGRVGELLARVDAGAMVGDYGTALRERVAAAPAPYDLTWLSLSAAADAVDALAASVREAQVAAQRAVELFNRGETATQSWEAAVEQQAAGALGPVLPPAVSDPGEEDRGQARRLLGAAQDEVARVAERTRAVLGEVAAAAPTFDRGFVAGAVDAWVGVGRFAMSAATDPWGTGAAAGQQTRHAVLHPRRTVGAALRAYDRAPREVAGGLLATAGPGVGAGIALKQASRADVHRPPPPARVGELALAPGPERVLPELEGLPLWKHVLHGEINHNGKGTGYHHRLDGQDGAGRKVVGPVTPGQFGTYQVPKVVFMRPDGSTTTKKNPTTFFPDAWSREQVRMAVSSAWQSRNRVTGPDRRWSGYTPVGMRISGYVDADGRPTTAYPAVAKQKSP